MLDQTSGVPLYRQLAEIICEQIISGELGPGDPLPSEAQLARDYEIGLNTVKQALTKLREQGLIISKRGTPHQVRPVRVISSERYAAGQENYEPDRESNFAREHGVPWSEFQVGREYRVIPAPPRVALSLQLPKGTPVYERTFTHGTGGVPLRFGQSYLEERRFANSPLTNPDEPLWPGGTIAQLRSIGIHLTHSHAEVMARVATKDEATKLNLPNGSPVLEVWRIQYAGDDPIETARHVYPPDRQLVVFEVPIKPKEGNEWKDVSYD